MTDKLNPCLECGCIGLHYCTGNPAKNGTRKVYCTQPEHDNANIEAVTNAGDVEDVARRIAETCLVVSKMSLDPNEAPRVRLDEWKTAQVVEAYAATRTATAEADLVKAREVIAELESALLAFNPLMERTQEDLVNRTKAIKAYRTWLAANPKMEV